MAAAPAGAQEDDRPEEVRVTGSCGRTSGLTMRLRAHDGRIRVDARVRTPATGVWRVSVFHERRLVRRVAAVARRAERGFEVRVLLPDYEGPDAVRVRAVAPRGESCSAAATLAGS